MRRLLPVIALLLYVVPASAQHRHPSSRPPDDHSAAGQPPPQTDQTGHAGHGEQHGQEPDTPSHDHAGHQDPAPAPDDHSHHGHETAEDALPPFIPPITDADRAAAFPDVMGHTVHDNAINYFVLFDQLEWRTGRDQVGEWEALGWVGRDIDRIWFRSEGTGQRDGVHHGEAHVFYGRAVRRWWDVLAGVRHDFGEGPNRTWAGVGVQGLAPYWFEVHATAWIGESGRTHVRLETEYEFLLTNRLILKPLVEIDVHGKSDVARGIGAGLSSVDTGLRLRYEFRREFAPYVGVTWDRKFLGTADLARRAGERTSGARLAVGLRLWM
jgi:copper resistance protein B